MCSSRRYPSLGPTERRDALNTLAARKGSAHALLAAVEAGKLPRADLTADLVRQLRNLKDRDLDARIGQVWGTVRETTGDRARHDRPVQGNDQDKAGTGTGSCAWAGPFSPRFASSATRSSASAARSART